MAKRSIPRPKGRSPAAKALPTPKDQHLVRSTTVGDRGQVVIPKEIRDRAGLKPGSRIMIMHHQANGPVILLPMDHMRGFMEQMVKQMKDSLT